MNRKIIMSVFVIAILTFALGAGTSAYFSDTAESTSNTFTAGTLDLQLRNDAVGSWADGVTATWSSSNLAPGDTVSAELRFKNVGTTGAWVIRIGGENLVENDANDDASPDLADKILITELYYSELGAYIPANLVSYYEPIFGNGDGNFTLREFVTSAYSMVFWIGPHPPTQYYLPANGGRVEMLNMTFSFVADAGNEYQADSASFDLKVVADQDWSILGKGSGCHGYN